MRRTALLALAAGMNTIACDATRPLPPAVFVDPAQVTLEDGQSVKLTATLRNPKSRSVTWVSANRAVATVDPLGTVTAVANGATSVVVMMVDDTTVRAVVPVTVSGPAVASVSLNPVSTVVYVGFARQIGVQLRAADGRVLRGRPITWTTPDATIAEVSSAGIVRGKGPGGPIAIAATSEGLTASTQVRVAHAAEACPFTAPLAVGQRADGSLALGDCEFPLDNSYVDVYEVTLPAAATVQIDMTSADLDSYLGLFDAAGVFIAQDDNSGGGRNAQLVRPLAAGKYRIWANTIGSAATGAYSLAVTQR